MEQERSTNVELLIRPVTSGCDAARRLGQMTVEKEQESGRMGAKSSNVKTGDGRRMTTLFRIMGFLPIIKSLPTTPTTKDPAQQMEPNNNNEATTSAQQVNTMTKSWRERNHRVIAAARATKYVHANVQSRRPFRVRSAACCISSNHANRHSITFVDVDGRSPVRASWSLSLLTPLRLACPARADSAL